MNFLGKIQSVAACYCLEKKNSKKNCVHFNLYLNARGCKFWKPRGNNFSVDVCSGFLLTLVICDLEEIGLHNGLLKKCAQRAVTSGDPTASGDNTYGFDLFETLENEFSVLYGLLAIVISVFKNFIGKFLKPHFTNFKMRHLKICRLLLSATSTLLIVPYYTQNSVSRVQKSSKT